MSKDNFFNPKMPQGYFYRNRHSIFNSFDESIIEEKIHSLRFKYGPLITPIVVYMFAASTILPKEATRAINYDY